VYANSYSKVGTCRDGYFDINDDTERAKCESEAETVAYVIGRY